MISDNTVNKGVFSDELKHLYIKPICKKELRNEKENYTPVTILPNLSKLFERCMDDQLNNFFDTQCTQHSLLAMIEKPRICLEGKEVSAAPALQ